MTLNELSTYFNSFLHIENFSHDPSRNGIQISNSSPTTKQIVKVAFAVDASLATMTEAINQGAQLLFVHHGIFWGDCTPITDIHYQRIATCIRSDLALYACHIPLDANELVGNNYGIAQRLHMTNLQPFGDWRGMLIGVKGSLPQPLSIEQLADSALLHQKPLHILPFGKTTITTVAIISGGAGEDFIQAVSAGVDAYITGEISHEEFHPIKEHGLTVIAGGHYQTETVGVNLVRQKLEKDTGIATTFIDIPTGL
ncbi:MAG: Nif3-like dinuclear metal center hexameric protein [Treponema sp.]|nr:Nif3-like dinuclear metal center hexameric protein [Treponema sp.]